MCIETYFYATFSLFQMASFIIKMTNKELSLYKICLENIAQLLKSTYWNVINYDFVDADYNPFAQLPSTIIDDLITQVTLLSESVPLKHTDLYHLISTGRVGNFKLEDLHVSCDDLLYILMQLSSKCQNLTLIKLKNVVCSDTFSESTRMSSMRRDALECVLTMAPKLKYVESCIPFSLKSLKNSLFLETLKLNFVPETHLFEFLEEVDGQFWPNNSLKTLEVFEDVRHPFSYLDIAVILRYCVSLVEINCDVSKSLEYLHAEEFYSGSINTMYKLEKCCFGSIYLDMQDAAVSREAVYIAAATCKSLKEIEVLVKDPLAIYGLRDFSNLSSLLLQWEDINSGNFVLGVESLLEAIGPQLNVLHLVNFCNIDFSVIGLHCPNLEELRVEYTGDDNHHEFSSTSFQKLISLHVENLNSYGCHASSLLGLVSNSTNLKFLTLQSADALTDSVLQSILDKNSLSNLKEARIYNCKLTAVGIRNLASHLKSLEYLELSSSVISFDLAVSIIHEINPQVIMSYVTFDE